MYIKRNCKYCNKEFIGFVDKYHSGIYCSKECNYNDKTDRAKDYIICPVCKKNFITQKYRKVKYCSRKCFYKGNTKETSYKDTYPNCKDCGKKLSRRDAIRCRKCAKPYQYKNCINYLKDYIGQSGKKSANWQGLTVLIKCDNCQKKIKRNKTILEKSKYNFCSKKCNSQFIRGEKHHCWKGGIARLPYPFDFNEELKELIRKRDNHKCQICGVPQEECIRKLDVHHKDYDKNNLNPDNLITLCKSCHMKTNFNREYWKIDIVKTYKKEMVK